jgi:mycinamicin biosynthesis methyltransferase MycE-like protein
MTVDATTEIERLVIAADGGPEALHRVLDELGAVRVTELVVAELLVRIDPPANPIEIRVGMRITHGAETVDRTWVLGAGRPVEVVDGLDKDCSVRLSYGLEDLVVEVWGSDRGRGAGVRRHDLATAFDLHFPPRKLQPSIAGATSTLLAALAKRAPDLGALAVRYGSDKWGQTHWFTQHYERHFGPLRDAPLRLLEIGVGGYGDEQSGGGSLKMWRRFFRRATIFGLDVFDKSELNGPRLQVLRGDQNDPAELAALAEEYGPFDIVIDDGSHINEHVLTSFRALFPYLRNGGFYVIEDLWTSYLPGYGGDDRDMNRSDTMIGLLKSAIDDLHHEELGDAPKQELSATEAGLVGVHVYHNIAFLEKGVNAEGGIPRWMPRAPHW